MKLIKTYKFENYPIEIVTSNKIRVKPYVIGVDKIPSKILDNIGIYYEIGEKQSTENGKKVTKQVIINIVTGEIIPKNTRSVGKERKHKISGQQLHELTLPPYMRSVIVETLKKYFLKIIKKQGVINYSNLNNLYFELVFNTDEGYLSTYNSVTENVIEDANLGDLDNHELFYKKVLFDCLQKDLYRKNTNQTINTLGFLPIDNVRYINHYTIQFIHTKNSRNLTLNIYDKINIK